MKINQTTRGKVKKISRKVAATLKKQFICEECGAEFGDRNIYHYHFYQDETYGIICDKQILSLQLKHFLKRLVYHSSFSFI